MPRVKVQKTKTSSDLPTINGNDASSTPTVTEAAASDVAEAIVKQPQKSKVRSKKAPAAATAAGEVNGSSEVEAAVVVARKPVARGKKKQPEDEIKLATNGNEALSSSPPKIKGRGKKIADVDEPEPTQVVAKKSAPRGKRKADLAEQPDEPESVKVKGRAKKASTKAADVATTSKSKQLDRDEEDEVEPTEPEPVPEPAPAKSRGRAKKATTESAALPTSKSKTSKKESATELATKTVVAPVTKGRSKKEQPSSSASPKAAKGRANKNEEQQNGAESETKSIPEPESPPEPESLPEPVPKSKAQGRKKKEPEQTEDTKASREKGRGKKDGDALAKKTTRGTKRHLTDAEIAAVLEEDEDEQLELEPPTQPEAKPAAKKRGKQTKINDENVEAPAKKRGKKTDNEEIVAAPAKKRVAKQTKDEVLPVETKPARSRKRPAGGAEQDPDTLVEDEADGSRMTKATKKAEPQSAESYDKALFPSPEDKPYNLKISSWNVAGLRAWLKKNGLGFVDAEEPDILCLQETKCANDQLPEEMARLPGYHPYWLCMPGGYAGVAIYSKIMPINVEYGIGNEEFDDVGRMITAEYEKFFLINVYVPNSGRKLVNLEMRMRWEQLFQAYVQKLDALKPVVICGDMNVSHLEIDLANPKSNTRNAGFTKEERDKMTELLALGYVDTFRHLYPKRTGAYTFWTYMANARSRNVGWRLDYCIVSQRFLPRVVDNVMRSHCLGSDHCPITVFINV